MTTKRKPGRLSDDFVRRVRRVFKQRAALPTDNQLAAEGGVTRATIRHVGMRKLYASVPDDSDH